MSRLDEVRDADFADGPRGGGSWALPFAAIFFVVLALAAAFLVGRWVGGQLWPAGEEARPVGVPVGVAGAWCGPDGMTVTLASPAPGRLSGRLRLGDRVSVLAGQVSDRGLVDLRTVAATVRFELSGALVEDRLRLNVVDDAGDTGRVELQRC